jgi:hypothetical protein
MVGRLRVERGTIIHFAKWTLALGAFAAVVWLVISAFSAG